MHLKFLSWAVRRDAILVAVICRNAELLIKIISGDVPGSWSRFSVNSHGTPWDDLG